MGVAESEERRGGMQKGGRHGDAIGVRGGDEFRSEESEDCEKSGQKSDECVCDFPLWRRGRGGPGSRG